MQASTRAAVAIAVAGVLAGTLMLSACGTGQDPQNAASVGTGATGPTATGSSPAGATPTRSSPVGLSPPPLPSVPGEPVAVVAHPDQLAVLANDDPELAANKRLLFDMWRTVLNAGQLELADLYVAEDYIQHSPFQRSGRQALKDVFAVIPRSEEIPATRRPAPVTIVAEGDLVVFVAVEEMDEPDGSGTYTTTHFNMFRVRDGQLAAHWHPDQTAPCPDLPGADAGGPQPVTGAAGTAQFALLDSTTAELASNKRLVFDLWRQLVDAGREEVVDLYLAADYVEHNPNAATGREGARAYFATRADRPIEVAIRSELVALLAEDDLVVQVLKVELPNPYREGETYTTARFDMFRVADGRLAEHWDAAVKPGTVVAELGAECAAEPSA
jgi:predicted SnoaL-like aldol condensation-catalyzing enzyme